MTTSNIYKTIVILLFSFNIAYSQTEIVENNSVNNTRVEELANIIDSSISNSDANAYLEKMDFNIFGQNIAINTEDSSMNDDQKSLMKGFIKGLESLPKRFIEEAKNGGYYDYVSFRYDAIKESYYILFRLFSNDDGINYHDYKVYEVDDELMIGDIYIYASGEYVSKTFNRIYVNSLPKNKLSKLFGEKKLKEFYEMINGLLLYRNGEIQKAYDIFSSLTSEIAKEKYFLILKSQFASQLNDELYKKSLKEIIDTYPNDTTLLLNHIDYYVLKGDYENALEILEQLEFQTNDDFLLYMKGNLEFEKGDYNKSSKHFKYITENYPDFFEGASAYLVSLTFEKKLDVAILFLDKLIGDGYLKTDLIDFIMEEDEFGENALKDLSESKLFKNWKK